MHRWIKRTHDISMEIEMREIPYKSTVVKVTILENCGQRSCIKKIPKRFVFWQKKPLKLIQLNNKKWNTCTYADSIFATAVRQLFKQNVIFT